VAVLTRAQLSGGAYVAAAFLIACVLSTATGTSLGTLILAVPLLYPPGGALGAHPAFLLAALLAGATFGDNLSPVSDTTIASAGTQGAAMGPVVRSRLRYAVPAGLFSLVLFASLGAGSQTIAPPGDQASLSLAALSMMAAPAWIFIQLLRGRHLLVAMLGGSALAIVLGVAGGLYSWSDLLYLDRDNFVARGLLADGLERSVGVSVLTLLLMGMAAGVEESGLLDRLVESARRRAQSARQAELWIFAATSVAVLVTTHAAVAILTVGDLARETGEAHRLAPERRANLIDVTVCTYPFLLPFFIPTILAASLSQSGADYGMPRVSALEAGLLNFHSWALLVLILVAIVTGWGRRRG